MSNYEKLSSEVTQALNSADIEIRVVLTIRSEGEIYYRVSEHVFFGDGANAADLAIDSARNLIAGGLDVVEE